MKQSSTPSSSIISLFLPSPRVALNLSLGLAVAAAPLFARAQDAAGPAGATHATPQADAPKPDISLSNEKPAKGKARKQEEKVIQSKDSKKADKKNAKVVSLTGKDTKLPDKALY